MQHWRMYQFSSVALLVTATLGGQIHAAQVGAPESIFVVRSVRESRVAATNFCVESRTGFAKASIEDKYSFRSIAIRPSDGLVTDTNVTQVATGHACLGPTEDPGVLNFYMEGVLGGVTYHGRGECRSGADAPEPGVAPQRCFLNLHDIPGYVGGQLATNTVVTRAIIGEQSDPLGYTQPSIAVIRLWKHR